MNNSEDLKAQEKKALRKALLEQRLNLPDRLVRADLLQRVMRIWLVGRPDTVIGAYWPIKGEFDPLPALHRWKEDGELLEQPQRRRIGLPVVDRVHKTMIFHAWYPGCPMEEPRSLCPPCSLRPAWAMARVALGWVTAVGFMTACWPR